MEVQEYGPEGLVFVILALICILLLKLSVELSIVISLIGLFVVLALRKGWFRR